LIVTLLPFNKLSKKGSLPKHNLKKRKKKKEIKKGTISSFENYKRGGQERLVNLSQTRQAL